MKVLFVTNMYPSPTGPYDGIFVQEQIQALQKMFDIEAEILVIEGGKSPLNYIWSIFKFQRLKRRRKFDIIHFHFGLSGICYLFDFANKSPTVLTLHGSDVNPTVKYGLMLKISKLVIRKVDTVIAVNESMLNAINEFRTKAIIVPCGVNLNIFSLERNNRTGGFVIGFPGDRSRPGKNYSLFSKIIQEIRAIGIECETVEFYDLTRKEVALALSRLDCLLMTSLSEGSPQIVKEAMAEGVPIITSNVGDVNRLLTGVRNCQIIATYNVADYVKALRRLIELPASERVTDGKMRLCQLQLDQESVSSKIFKLYSQLASSC